MKKLLPFICLFCLASFAYAVTPTPKDAVCGLVADNVLKMAPSVPCSVGGMTAMMGTKNGWFWTCDGISGGKAAFCRAYTLRYCIDNCGICIPEKHAVCPINQSIVWR